MAVEVIERTIDFAMADYHGSAPRLRVFEPGVALEEDEHALQCFLSLMGETAPVLSPLSASYGAGEETRLYRYDWMFGIACLREDYWNWQAGLREQSAMAIQLLISTGGAGLGFSEIATNLLALQPARNTQSWLETNAQKMGAAMTSVAGVTEKLPGLPGSSSIAGALRTSAALANFVASGEGKGKNWFIYRFVDPESRCCCVEWKINRKVLHEYGPLLRGSLVLAFHGRPGTPGAMKIELRPQLGYFAEDELCHIAPTRIDPAYHFALKLNPIEAKGA